MYPEILEDGSIAEVWHAEKWHNHIGLSALSPMYDAGDKHYYVQEVCKLQNGALVVPFRWVVFRGIVHADIHGVRRDAEV